MADHKKRKAKVEFDIHKDIQESLQLQMLSDGVGNAVIQSIQVMENKFDLGMYEVTTQYVSPTERKYEVTLIIKVVE